MTAVPPQMFDPGLGPQHLGRALVLEAPPTSAVREWDAWWASPGLVVTELEGPDACRVWRLIPWVRVLDVRWRA